MKIRMFMFFTLVLFLTSAFAEPVMRIAITKGFKQRPVAAFPSLYGSSKELGSLKEEMDTLLRKDLILSGRVTILDKQSAVNECASSESFAKTDKAHWVKIGVEFIIKAELSDELGALKLSYIIYDIHDGKQIGGHTLKGTKKNYRDLGHKTSDEICQVISGKKGLGMTRLAFVTDVKGTKTIFSCDIEGRDIFQLIFDKSITLSPCWGPNRESLLYTSFRLVNPSLFLKHFGTNRVETVSSFPGLNANGKMNSDYEVVFTASVDGNPEIYRKNVQTGEVRRLTRRKGVDANPCWGPEGKLIAFTSSAYGNPQICIMNRDGQNIRPITDTKYNTSPEFSSDGRYLAYVTDYRGKLAVAMYDFENDVNEILVGNMGGNSESPCWSPDNSYHVAFHSDRGGKSNIYIIDVETREVYQVTKDLGNCTNPTWR